MESVLISNRLPSATRPSHVREDAALYRTKFEKKVDEYLSKIELLEPECLQPTADRERLSEEVGRLTDTMLAECANFEYSCKGNAEAVEQTRKWFRARTNPVLSKSYTINHARTWPRGYQGDYQALEIAYRNTPLSDGLGFYLDKYMLSLPLADALRGRIEKLRDLLSAELSARKEPNVLDIACGSCREVIELAPEIKESGARFTCVDLDSEALNFALQRLSYAGIPDGQIEFLTYNALRIFDYETALAEFGTRDIIYSVGFFDYLPDEFLVKLLRTLYMLLNPGGRLIAAFKDARRYRPEVFHWLVDWDGFRQRTEIEFERLLRDADIPRSAVETCRDASGAIIFYSAVKRNN